MDKVTPEDLRQKFLDKASIIVDYKLATATGQQEIIPDVFAIPREIDECWGVAKQLILQAKDLKNIEAKSTADVTTALAKGKITATEALKLMEMLKLRSDVEELPKMLEQLKELSQK